MKTTRRDHLKKLSMPAVSPFFAPLSLPVKKRDNGAVGDFLFDEKEFFRLFEKDKHQKWAFFGLPGSGVYQISSVVEEAWQKKNIKTRSFREADEFLLEEKVVGDEVGSVLAFQYWDFAKSGKMIRKLRDQNYRVVFVEGLNRAGLACHFFVEKLTTTEKPLARSLFVDKKEREGYMQILENFKNFKKELSASTESIIEVEQGFEEELRDKYSLKISHEDSYLGQLSKPAFNYIKNQDEVFAWMKSVGIA